MRDRLIPAHPLVHIASGKSAQYRKSLIVDGRVAFTGAAGIADQRLGDAANPQEWPDIAIRVEGPAVVPLQSGLVQNWLLTTGEPLGGHKHFRKRVR